MAAAFVPFEEAHRGMVADGATASGSCGPANRSTAGAEGVVLAGVAEGVTEGACGGALRVSVANMLRRLKLLACSTYSVGRRLMVRSRSRARAHRRGALCLGNRGTQDMHSVPDSNQEDANRRARRGGGDTLCDMSLRPTNPVRASALGTAECAECAG